MKSRKWRDPEDHPAPEALLLHIDGELTADESSSIETHLKQCWTCRTVSDQLELGIRRFVHKREQALAAQIPPPPSGWEGFSVRLHQAASQEIPAGLELFARLRALWSRVSRPVLVACAAMIGMIAILVGQSLFWTAHRDSSPATAPRRVKERAASAPSGARTSPLQSASGLVMSIEPRGALPARMAPTAEQLADSEWRARLALHQMGADMGDDLRFTASAGEVTLSGVVETAERKQDIAQVLAQIPFLKVQLQTVTEAAAVQVTTEPPPNLSPPVVSVSTPMPALQEEMSRLFPKSEDRSVFVNRVLALTGRGSAEGFALRSLLDRYDQASLALLTPASKAQLEGVIREHVSKIDLAVADERQAMEPLTGSAVPSPEAAGAPDWRSQLSRMTSKAIGLNEHVMEALSGSRADSSAEAVKSAIASDLQSITATTRSVAPQLRQSFLTPNQPEQQ